MTVTPNPPPEATTADERREIVTTLMDAGSCLTTLQAMADAGVESGERDVAVAMLDGISRILAVLIPQFEDAEGMAKRLWTPS